MNESDGIVRMQVDALKELLEQSRSSQCSEARERAALQAGELRTRARKQARERVGKAAREERERLEREVRMVEAEIDTEQRKRARARDSILIEAGRTTLEQALAARWRQRADREAWADAAVADAAAVLLGREWTLEYPADWPADERDRLIEHAQSHYGAAVNARPDDQLKAGLRIRSKGALVDMTIAGLLANERSIEGELLAEFNRAAEGETS
jgi:hypothetical protein